MSLDAEKAGLNIGFRAPSRVPQVRVSQYGFLVDSLKGSYKGPFEIPLNFKGSFKVVVMFPHEPRIGSLPWPAHSQSPRLLYAASLRMWVQ